MTRTDREAHLVSLMYLIDNTSGNAVLCWLTMALMTITDQRRVKLQPEEWPQVLANAFHSFRLVTWGDLERFNAKHFLRAQGLGRWAFNHVISGLKAHGLDGNDGQLPAQSPEIVASPERGPGVYFIQCGDFVKVGFANDVRKRLRALSHAMPMQPELLCVIRTGTATGARAIEAAVHERYRQHRVRGEWFHREPLEEIIRPLRFGDPVRPW